ncbi:L,D-transpeptidase [Caloramator proteoclasticus]|uniref:Lipoprotein-anchoring transpeptidase ErfK/SrfK n=1 Tax=Caloramator proteoclasticus DSM 10124 TaxID=1121262 RepID=A0A1M4U483_9CLOT|nr:L,D-transpeptidase [Caloramator proteoclasticus]SHE51539.1 Lipoprotein-anchoring transpeptidase ErfK/SrfK [Caloramator proteoclasticus DSM 10124]
MQKKKILKNMIVLFLFFVSLISFSGCNKETSNESNQNEQHIVVAKAENKKEEIKVDAVSDQQPSDNNKENKEQDKNKTNTLATKESNKNATKESVKTSEVKNSTQKQTVALTPLEQELLKDIKEKNLTSKTAYMVIVDTQKQYTYIMKKSNGSWGLYKSLICSTGAPETPTPKGIYTIQDRAPWFFSKRYQQGGMYWVRFKGDYLFHSLPMDENKNIVDYTLGKPASHGCVRLKVEDAKWFYNSITFGTKLYIK